MITCRIGTSSSCYAANLGSRLVGTEASVFQRDRESGDPSDPMLVQNQRPSDERSISRAYDPLTRGSRSPRFITVPPNVRASKDHLDLFSVDYSSHALRLSEFGLL